MFKLILASALVASAIAAFLPVAPNQYRGGSEANAQIVKQSSDVQIDRYNYGYETENGIAASEQGQLKQLGPQEDGIVAQGQYQYYSPDGTPISISYIADENGFQPQGAHLPTPPPIPEAIQRSLAYNAANPESPQPGQAPFRRPIF